MLFEDVILCISGLVFQLLRYLCILWHADNMLNADFVFIVNKILKDLMRHKLVDQIAFNFITLHAQI